MIDQAIAQLPWDDKLAADDAGFGALQTEKGCLPLKSLDVEGHIRGLTARVLVRQCFRNTLSESLEATYIFPLPDRAAVTSFTMRVGERRIEAELKEREQARADYDQAIEDGHRAAIAEEERSGTFTIRVGNIPPGEDALVELTLVMPLDAVGAEATFRFPLVVAPRYVPGIPLDGPSVGTGTAVDTDQVPDASRVTPPVLLPGFPNPVRLSLNIDLEPAGLYADGWASRLACTLHSVVTESGPPLKLRLQSGEQLDRDFILRIPLAGDAVAASLQMAPPSGERSGTFALTLVPPASKKTARRPCDVVFVLDRSGSMGGWKMVAARRSVGRMIDTLRDQDRFALVAFDTVCESPAGEVTDKGAARLMQATNRRRWRAIEWLNGIDARGGTEMGPALKAAVQMLKQSDPDERELILVLVTDGQVAGEDVLLRTLQRAAGDRMPRVLAVGIDEAVNAGFLRRLAGLGGGWCELIESEDRLDETMDRIHRTIASPVLREIRLEPLGWSWDTDSVVPQPLPDLFAERPVVISGRYRSTAAPEQLQLKVHGVTADGQPWSQAVTGRAGDDTILRPLWGRDRVRALEDRYASGRFGDEDEATGEQLARQIVTVSLETGVLSRFTAMVAVDRSEVVNEAGQVISVTQPVQWPSGWDSSAARGYISGFGPAPRAMAPLAHFARPLFCLQSANRSFSSHPDRSALQTITATIRKIRRARRASTRRRLWQQLAEQLSDWMAELADGDTRRARLEQLVQRIEQRLADDDAGQPEALSGAAAEQLLDDVVDLLPRRGHSSKGRRQRGQFWK